MGAGHRAWFARLKLIVGGHFLPSEPPCPNRYGLFLIGLDLRVRTASPPAGPRQPGRPSHRRRPWHSRPQRREGAPGGQITSGRSLFIDGDYAHGWMKRSDAPNYRDLVRDGGVIAFHDIADDHLTRFGRVRQRPGLRRVPLFWRRLKPHAEISFRVCGRSGAGWIRHRGTDPFLEAKPLLAEFTRPPRLPATCAPWPR